MELTYTYWQDREWYVGHLNDYPDYDSQGKTLEELETMLKSLYDDIKTGEIPFIRRQGVIKMSSEGGQEALCS